MKFIVAFLACIVAAQASTFSCPTYDYWCSHNFHVLPPRSYYCYTVPFNSAWCTSQYYADCLLEFPKAEGTSCEAEKTDVESCIRTYTTKLETARGTIRTTLEEGLEPFTNTIDALHLQYVNTYKAYLKLVHDEGTTEYNTKVSDYEAELLAIKNQAITDFNNAVDAAMTRIESFHTQIIAQFRSCLVSRTAKINSYNTQLDTRVTSIVSQYRTRLEAIVTKKVTWVRSVFDKLYAGKEKHADHEAAMTAYNTELSRQVDTDVSAFESELATAVNELKTSYRCNSKCYFQTGCYGFSRRSYSRSCVRLPSPPKTSYKLVGIGAFKADWNGCAYRCLRTCTEEEKTCTFDHQSHLTEIESRETTYKSDLSTKVSGWRDQVNTWETTATTSLTAIIQTLQPRSYCGVAPTPEEIAAFRAAAQTIATNWIAAKKAEFLAQITAIETRVTGQIESWKTRADAYINRVKAQFDCCVTNKQAKISSYTTSLEAKKVAAKAALNTKLTSMATQHKSRFDQFHIAMFGATPAEPLIVALKTNYHTCVDNKVTEVLGKFDTFWNEWQPKLVEHYTCGFKCTTSVTTPSLNLCYNWNFCAPSLSTCKFY